MQGGFADIYGDVSCCCSKLLILFIMSNCSGFWRSEYGQTRWE